MQFTELKLWHYIYCCAITLDRKLPPCGTLTHFLVYTNGKKKSEGSLALMVGGALNPGLADSDTSMKLTELMTETTPPPVKGDGW